MKFKSAPFLLAAFSVVHPLAASAQTANAGGEPVPPPSSGKPAMVDPGPKAEPEENPLPRECLVRLEVFTLPRDEGRAATRNFPKQADLYHWLGAELEKELTTVKLERLMVLRVRGGQKSKLEEIDEYPVSGVLDPPQIPQIVGIGQPAPATMQLTVTPPAPPPAAPAPNPSGSKGEAGRSGLPGIASPLPPGSSPAGSVFPPWPYIPAQPHGYTFRNTGWTVWIELTIPGDGETVDVVMAPEFVRLCGLESQSPNGEVVQPIFEVSKIATRIMAKLGQPTLAGTFSPPVDAGAEGGNMEKVTRFLFMTVTNPR